MLNDGYVSFQMIPKCEASSAFLLSSFLYINCKLNNPFKHVNFN